MADSARRAVVELAASQHRTLTRHQAAELHFDHRRVATAKRDGWLAEPLRGVLTLVEGGVTWEQNLQALILASDGRAVVSHRSAARLHEFEGFEARTVATLELSVPATMRFRPRFECVIHHVDALEPCDITTVNGLRCVTRPRALGEIGSVVADLRTVRRALTSARRRGLDLEHTRRVAERLHRPGQRGTGVLLSLLDSIRWEGELPATWFEELPALCLDDPGLPEMHLQYPIRRAAGDVVARPDIAFPSVRLGVEAHSRRYHTGPDAEPLDEQGDIAAGLCGWELTYLGWSATKRPAEVLRAVKELIAVRMRTVAGEL